MSIFLQIECDEHENYDAVDFGTFVDADGDRFDGMPGVVAHDYPDTVVAVEVEGGYMCFSSYDEYETWSEQI